MKITHGTVQVESGGRTFSLRLPEGQAGSLFIDENNKGGGWSGSGARGMPPEVSRFFARQVLLWVPPPQPEVEVPDG